MSNFQSLAPSGTTEFRQYMCSKLLNGPRFGSKPREKTGKWNGEIWGHTKNGKNSKNQEFGGQ